MFVNNHIIAEQIDSLLVYCKYASKRNERDESGCPVKIPLIKKRLISSKAKKKRICLFFREHEDECNYRFVSCPNGCLQINLRQKVSNHIYYILLNTNR
jgi:hypothetical protein